MSPVNVQRRLARLAKQLENIQSRIEKLSAAMDGGMSKPQRRQRAEKGTRRRKGGGGRQSKAIGKVIKYRGAKVRVLEKRPRRFIVKALGSVELPNGRTKKKGATFPVSSTYVFKQVA